MHAPATALRRRPVYVAALCSGAATLIYELAWTRVLVLAVGATWPALTVVLAGMMLGLGLGAVVGGRLVDRGRPPLRTYVAVELLVIAVAAGFPLLAALIGTVPLGPLGPLPGRALLAGQWLQQWRPRPNRAREPSRGRRQIFQWECDRPKE